MDKSAVQNKTAFVGNLRYSQYPLVNLSTKKRFFDFIGKLGGEKMAILSHTSDLDGVASAKIANRGLNADILKFVDYPDLNDKLVDELKKLK